MKKPFILLAIFFLFNFWCFAQDDEVKESKHQHAIGAVAGFTTGYGLSYKYSYGRFGAFMAFSPFKDKRNSRFSFGLTFQFTLVEGNIANLFLYQGNHYHVTKYERNPWRDEIIDDYLNNGIGFGVEFHIAPQVGLSFMGGYASYDSFEGINITGESSLFYKF